MFVQVLVSLSICSLIANVAAGQSLGDHERLAKHYVQKAAKVFPRSSDRFNYLLSELYRSQIKVGDAKSATDLTIKFRKTLSYPVINPIFHFLQRRQFGRALEHLQAHETVAGQELFKRDQPPRGATEILQVFVEHHSAEEIQNWIDQFQKEPARRSLSVTAIGKLSELDRAADAKQIFKRVDFKGENGFWMVRFAKALAHAKDFDTQNEILQLLLNSNRENQQDLLARLYGAIGKGLHDSGRLEEAEQYFMKAFQAKGSVGVEVAMESRPDLSTRYFVNDSRIWSRPKIRDFYVIENLDDRFFWIRKLENPGDRFQGFKDIAWTLRSEILKGKEWNSSFLDQVISAWKADFPEYQIGNIELAMSRIIELRLITGEIERAAQQRVDARRKFLSKAIENEAKNVDFNFDRSAGEIAKKMIQMGNVEYGISIANEVAPKHRISALTELARLKLKNEFQSMLDSIPDESRLIAENFDRFSKHLGWEKTWEIAQSKEAKSWHHHAIWKFRVIPKFEGIEESLNSIKKLKAAGVEYVSIATGLSEAGHFRESADVIKMLLDGGGFMHPNADFDSLIRNLMMSNEFDRAWIVCNCQNAYPQFKEKKLFYKILLQRKQTKLVEKFLAVPSDLEKVKDKKILGELCIRYLSLANAHIELKSQ